MSANDLTLDRIRRLSDCEDDSGVHCPDCRGRLAIHQPDERLPERLLGTCRCCFAWYLLDAEFGIVARLLDEETLTSVREIARAGPPGRSPTRATESHRRDGPETANGRPRKGRGDRPREGGRP